ncbi:MAG: DUF4129 domain-containing protein [Prevotella sp.]|nr:DUF4129 domain-containing protein [Prevotella sp.]
MNVADTLSIAQETLRKWQSDYDYTSGLSPITEKELSDNGLAPINDLPTSPEGSSFIGDIFSWLGNLGPVFWIIVLVLLLALVAWWVMRHTDWHKKKADEEENNDDEVVDNIYEIDDYATPIDEAVARGDWAEALRLVYLSTLRRLDDEGRIRWQKYKTPMDYVSEADSESLRLLTLHYLLVRFGHYPADESLYQQALLLRDEIEKGGHHA